jgi:hypothetical protein
MDWVWTLEDDADGAAIRTALAPVATARRWQRIDAPDACCALAAAAVVATSAGGYTEALPDEAEAWVAANRELVGPDLVALAEAAVTRVRRSSELRDLWNEAGAAEWLAAVDELSAGLARGPT